MLFKSGLIKQSYYKTMDIQQSSVTDTTSLMNKYNFVKPVTVTVIYEEDEEKVKEINIDKRNVNSLPNQELNNTLLKQNSPRKSSQTTAEYAEPDTKDNYSLLLTVAQNMSYIVEAYNKYKLCLKRDVKEAIVLKCNYIHTKSRNYRKSFEIAYRLILPHKANKRLEDFLLQKVNELSKAKIDSTYVKWLFDDLLFWTERMKDQILAQSNQARNLPSCSINIKNKSNGDNPKPNKVTIFSAGTKGNEVVLSVDPQYLRTVSDKQTNCRNKRQKPEQNTSTSKDTTSSNKLNHPLKTDALSNTQKDFISQSERLNNVNISNLNNPIHSVKKAIPKSCGTYDANPSIKRHENVDNTSSNIIPSQHNNTLAHNRSNQEKDTMSTDSGSSVSFQALMEQMDSFLDPQTSEKRQKDSYQNGRPNILPTYSTSNVVRTHNNINNYSTRPQIPKLNQNIYPPQNTTSGNISSYSTSMPVQYTSETNNAPQIANLYCSSMVTVNGRFNQNYEHPNFTNTLSGYRESYYNNYLIDRSRHTHQQYVAQNTYSRDRGFIAPVTYNSPQPQMNLAAYQDRPNWFNI